MRILLTGVTGFIGRNLAAALINNNDEVFAIVRPKSDVSVIPESVKYYVFNGSYDSMNSIIENTKPEVVIHLASLFLSQHTSNDVGSLIRSNIEFGTLLLEGMDKNNCKLLINTGTSWQHYNNEEYNPVNLYAATKQAFEDMIVFYVEASDLKVITLKLFDTYGPDDPRPKLFTLLRKVAEEQTELAMSPGEQLIDLVYIDDVIDGYFRAAKRLMDNKVSAMEEYVISSGNPISLKDLVVVYGKTIGKVLRIKWGGRPYRTREVMVPWNKDEMISGWKAKIRLVEGIKKMEKIK